MYGARASALRALATALTACALALMLPRGAAAQGIRAEPWFTVETEHFSVHAHRSVAPMAAEVAAMCEQAHTLLVPLFPGHVRQHTDVVLFDPSDAANGSASVLPRNEMELQAMAPEAGSVLGDYDNWMWNLIVHEYTHILQLDEMSRLLRWLNVPLGPRFAPNQALPRWLIEGLATYQESAHSSSGRINSSLFRMYLRAAALEGRVPQPGTLSGAPTCWPQATGWYLFGGFFVDWVARTRGWDAWSAFIENYGRRPVPYAINVTAQATLGDDIMTLWAQWQLDARATALAEAVVARASGAVPLEPVTTRGHRSRFVTSDRAGRVAWLRHDGHAPPAIQVFDGTSTRTVRVDDDGEFVLVPGEDALIVSQAHLVGQANARRDLFYVPLDGGPWTELTHGARARDPAIDAEGARLAFVAPSLGRTDLWVMDAGDAGSARVIAEAPPWGQYARPAFTPDGRTIIAMLQAPGGLRDLVAIDVETGARSALTSDAAIDADPFVAADGRTVMFSADRAGRFELYALDMSTGAVSLVAASETGLFSPTVVSLPDGEWLYASSYNADGFDIVRTRWSGVPDVPAAASYARDIPPLPPAPEVSAMRRYAPIRHLPPTGWGVNLGLAGGRSIAGFTANGSDPAGLHAWTLVADWSFERETPVFAGTWATSALPVGVSMSLARLVTQRDRGLLLANQSVPWLEEQWTASVATSVAFGQPRSTHGLSVSFAFDWRDALRWPSYTLDPGDRPPQYPVYRRLHSLALGWGWSRVRGEAWSISTERGVALSLSSRFRAEELGAQVDSAEVGGRIAGYVPMPWREHHVLAIRANAALGTASRLGRRLYSVGGIDPQDVLSALIDQLPASNAHVRGYAPGARVGDRYVRVNAEYRFPLFRLDAGIGTLPLFLRRVWAAVFVDVGEAAYEELAVDDLLTGLGAELRMSATFGYFTGASFRLGVARGLGYEGVTDVYLLYGFDW